MIKQESLLKEIVSILESSTKLSEEEQNQAVRGFAEIGVAKAGDLTILIGDKQESLIYSTKATATIVSETFTPKEKVNTVLIKVSQPREALRQLLVLYNELVNPARRGISKRADISPESKIGKNVYIGAFVTVEEGVVIEDEVQVYPNSYIGKKVHIGQNSVIYANVNIHDHTHIGQDVVIEFGATIGSTGFGFVPQKDGSYLPLPQVGNVVIKNRVYIGANTTIDRATLGSTTISEGCIIDNLVQIGHNVHIGKNTAIVAQVGISGSTKLGEGVRVGGQVGFADHIEVADGATIGSQSGVHRSLTEKNGKYFGSPILPWRDEIARYFLPKKVAKLEKQLQGLLEKQNK